MLRKFLPRINLLLCGICLVLILIDAVWPDILLFNSSFVKAFILISCLVTAFNAILLIARYRRR